ncbi:MAG: nicotinate (nicotinamide) nucleotide adenylyltransferase [Schleiferiaceae bacterium]|nr:nicotinate (nicotinamide) nucleotide adenylyltransferase [Schleiferiaceae bacterium]
MKTGLLFGTYNPIHRSHLILAQSLADWKSLDEVWFVVTPHNPHKIKEELLEGKERLHMVRLATAAMPHLLASDFEFSLAQPNYTVDSLLAFQNAFPQRAFYLLMGADNLLSFPRWKSPEAILDMVHILVYPRPETEIPGDNEWMRHPKIHLMDAPLMDRSASEIRERLGMNADAKDDLTPEVAAYIEAQQHYR